MANSVRDAILASWPSSADWPDQTWRLVTKISDRYGEVATLAALDSMVEEGREFPPIPPALLARLRDVTGQSAPSFEAAWSEVQRAIVNSERTRLWSHAAIGLWVRQMGWHRLRFAPAEDAFGFTQFMQVARIEYAAAVERERLASNDEREGLLAIPQTTADLTRRYLAARADGDEAAAAQLQNAIVESMVGAKPREVASGQRNLLTSGGDEGAPNVMEEAAKVLAITGPRQRGVIGSTRHLTAEELQERVAAEIADRAPRATKLAQQVRERDGEA
jgi:hypothetical protein